VFSRTQLLDSLHADQRGVSERAIDSHVKNLHRKMQAIEPESGCIASGYSVGYCLDQPL
jgi:two-component system, OmpR family, response regulator BaeR